MVGFNVTPTLTLTPSINDLLSLCEALVSLSLEVSIDNLGIVECSGMHVMIRGVIPPVVA